MSVTNALSNLTYKALGLGFMVLAKAQNLLRGYRRPRPYDTSEVERTIGYCRHVVTEWMDAYGQYTGQTAPPLTEKRILELGPGPDFCNAVILLSKGAASYASLDAFELALSTPRELYQRLYETLQLDPRIREELAAELDNTLARGACDEIKSGEGRIRYAVRPDFDLVKAFPDDHFDLFLSNAAFEHFDDVERTLRQMTALSHPGSQLVISIDFKTHTRWICDKDPLNIYRYSDTLYGVLSFKGSPNRVILPRYVGMLESLGWRDIRQFHIHSVPDEQFARIRDSLAPRFRNDDTRYLWATLCATRG